jgi:hypothetical protein
MQTLFNQIEEKKEEMTCEVSREFGFAPEP